MIRNTPKEELLMKVEELAAETNLVRQQKALASEAEEKRTYLERVENDFVQNFAEQVFSLFNISRKQLCKLGETELKELKNIIEKKAKLWSSINLGLMVGFSVSWTLGAFVLSDVYGAALFALLFLFFIPFTWTAALSVKYLSSARKLKKNYGDNYFPTEKLQQYSYRVTPSWQGPRGIAS